MILTLTKQKIELRPFVPHGVIAKVQQIAFRGLKLDMSAANATKEELLQAFGAETMQAVDTLKGKEYDKRLSELRQELLKKSMKIDGGGLEAAEEANIARIEGMVLSVDGVSTSVLNGGIRAWAAELPEPDFQQLIEEINRIEQNPEWKKNDAGGKEPDPGADS